MKRHTSEKSYQLLCRHPLSLLLLYFNPETYIMCYIYIHITKAKMSYCLDFNIIFVGNCIWQIYKSQWEELLNLALLKYIYDRIEERKMGGNRGKGLKNNWRNFLFGNSVFLFNPIRNKYSKRTTLSHMYLFYSN